MNAPLSIPDDHLKEVILVIRTGIINCNVSEKVSRNLLKWCDETTEYLNSNEESTLDQ